MGAMIKTQGRRKVKSGCRTCKSRKVKCDEGRPACRRCVSNGRVCDGYGVWGGGGTFCDHDKQSVAISKVGGAACEVPTAISIIAASSEEMQCFEWFKLRTATNIPGAFVLTFWKTLVFQTSLREPAVWHAVLALSSVHKNGSYECDNQSKGDIDMDRQEQFMLRQYSKAISHLQPHFSSYGASSVRIALIACIVFVSLELLRGRFNTAQTHLENGMKVLRESRNPGGVDDTKLLLIKPSRDSSDNWITEALYRLHFQVVLFKQSYQLPNLIVRKSWRASHHASAYTSFNIAWKGMEWLLSRILHLSRQCRQEDPFFQKPSEILLQRQRSLQTELKRWLETYEMSRQILQPQDFNGHGCQLLYTYYNMASIMANVCLRSDDEMAYDSYTNQFVALVDHSTKLLKSRSMNPQAQALPGHRLDMSQSIVDIGWIPPLYYTALKCRVHRVRLLAIKLLESTSHREGIWDGKIAGCVARKVMEMEEGDFRSRFGTNDGLPLVSTPSLSEISLPTLPRLQRLQEVEVVLPDGPEDILLLFCKHDKSNGDCEVISSEYHKHLQGWKDRRNGEKVETRGSAVVVALGYIP